MEDIFSNISKFSDDAFTICFLVIFYLSIKTCFWNGKRNKVALFFLTFLTSPLVMMLVILILPLSTIKTFDNSNFLFNNLYFSILYLGLVMVVYLLLQNFFAGVIARWLGVTNKSLVLFVYLIFGVFLELEELTVQSNIFCNNPLLLHLSNICVNLIITLCMLLLYFLVIKNLAIVADKQNSTSRKIFVISPAIFIVGFNTFAFSFIITNNLIGQTLTVIFSSSFIVFLFTWAFYIIIKNIAATSEALKAKDEVKTLSVEVMEALANTIDAKDKYTNGHSIRVAKYARKMAEKMGLPDETCENIYYMGLLHDIGKIGIPNEIINKPTRLDDREYEIIKKHPGIGYDILSKIQSKPELMRGARWHHERFDGKGYPDQISGEKIPIESRIIAIADSYDAMTSNRSYRQYLPQYTVRAEIEKNSGTQFDPEIAKYMLMIIDEDTEYVLHE